MGDTLTDRTVLGVVLAGGASRRMGVDKASMHVDGVPMLSLVATALSTAGATTVVVAGASAAAREVAAACGLEVIEEPAPGAGPLSGIAAGLDHARDRGHDIAVVVACDLPRLDPSVLKALAAHVDATADVVCAASSRGIEPLISAWNVATAAPVVDDALVAGRLAVRSVFDTLTVATLAVTDDSSLVNINTPEDAATMDRSDRRGASMSIPEISVDELADRLDAGARLVDVRELDEWLEARVPGVPLVVLSTVPDRVDELRGDGPLHIICKSGGRSMQAAEFLAQHGIDVVNVAGGTMAWLDSGRAAESGPAA